jgi:hypothetical protein
MNQVSVVRTPAADGSLGFGELLGFGNRLRGLLAKSAPIGPQHLLGSSADNGKPGRGVPDIAMSATNYFTRVDTSEGASGGTSAVAPLMAALVARLNQAKKKKVGFLNPFLYSHVARAWCMMSLRGRTRLKTQSKATRPGRGGMDAQVWERRTVRPS